MNLFIERLTKIQLAGKKPAVRAKPMSKGDGEPCRNQVNLGRAWLMRPVEDAEARTAGKRPPDEKRHDESCVDE
jgi:hypothetical protein